MIWVLIMMVVLPLLFTALLMFGSNETLNATRSYRKLQTEYVARSGAEVGYKKLINGNVSPQTNIANFVLQANTTLTGLTGTIGTGQYVITYDDYSATTVLITSTATNNDDPTITTTVKLYMDTLPYYAPTDAWSAVPDSWQRSHNMNPDINPYLYPDQDAKNLAVAFTGEPTQSPQNDPDTSIFRATVMQFRGTNNAGITFRMINTNSLKLISEVILFNGIVEIKGSDDLLLSTDGILDSEIPDRAWTDQDASGYDTDNSGFETRERYFYYIEEDDPQFDTPPDEHPYDDYEFPTSAGQKYGLVYFAGGVENKDDSDLDIPEGWYFFHTNINLNDPVDITDTYTGDIQNLIRINDDDPIDDITTNEKQGQKLVGAGDTKIIYSK